MSDIDRLGSSNRMVLATVWPIRILLIMLMFYCVIGDIQMVEPKTKNRNNNRDDKAVTPATRNRNNNPDENGSRKRTPNGNYEAINSATIHRKKSKKSASKRPFIDNVTDNKCFHPVVHSKNIPIYWVNLKRSKGRSVFYNDQMSKMNFIHERVTGVTPMDDVVKNAIIKVIPRVQHTQEELSCVISHLIAIHTAIYDSKADIQNPYALITEDDVNFEMDVDFRSLAESAPKNFGALQLMTSSSSSVQSLWREYVKKRKTQIGSKLTDYLKNTLESDNLIWSPRKFDAPYWSTQAYLINKRTIKLFIDKAISYNNSSRKYSINIVNPSEDLFPCSGQDKCHIPFRIVCDMYIFAGCGPSYIANIPMFNGALVGENSTIHKRKNNDVSHSKSFNQIIEVINNVRKEKHLLPDFIRVKNCSQKN